VSVTFHTYSERKLIVYHRESFISQYFSKMMVVMSDRETNQAAEQVIKNPSRSLVSRAECVTKLEEEATGLSFTCHYEGCESSTSGFSQPWKLTDHLRRVHNDVGLPPPRNGKSIFADSFDDANQSNKRRKLSITDILDKKPNIVRASPTIPPVSTIPISGYQTQFLADKAWETSGENFLQPCQNLGQQPDIWGRAAQPMVQNSEPGWQSVPHTNPLHDFTGGSFNNNPTYAMATDLPSFGHTDYGGTIAMGPIDGGMEREGIYAPEWDWRL
jgi:hypothetical protein